MFLLDMLMMLLTGLIMIICVMVSVAFLTLLERKVLGYIQLRKGPNKIGLMGLVQPFSDAIKLFMKEQVNSLVINFFSYYMSPIFSLFLSLLVWMTMPLLIKVCSFNLGILFFLCCISMGVYTIMVAGWSSNSNYALLGGLRSVAQTISYEVSLALLLMSFVFLIGGYNFFLFNIYQKYIWFIFLLYPLSLVWFISSLAEVNRTPFDFAEGESELVSGFNVEYSSGGFALIFLAEYASILFMSMLYCIIFLGADVFNLLYFLKLVLISFLFIWIRGTLPRFRYDMLMDLAWKKILPLSLNYLFFFIMFKIFVFDL